MKVSSNSFIIISILLKLKMKLPIFDRNNALVANLCIQILFTFSTVTVSILKFEMVTVMHNVASL